MQQATTSANATLQSPNVNVKKSLLTRIASPFGGGKSRTVTEFTVQADDPHRRYAPGDVIKGNVILKLVKAVRVTHIVVCLHGFAQVYRTPGVPPADGFRAHNNLIGKGRGKRRGEYFGNGFASLFEDEGVVCGDGRLEEGNYKFEFKMRFPDETMPSSIDFERGTITYMVTATMTRPNSMSPTLYHDQEIQFAERIDVSKLLPPKPRTITLEPLIKRPTGKSTSSKRRAGQSDSTRQEDGSGSQLGDGPSTTQSQTSTTGDFMASARSSSPSIRSTTSLRSSGNRQASESMRSSKASDCGSSPHDHGSNRNHTITVHVESLRGGTLRGETIPLRITVNHTKPIRSMQGVIATLYRQARVDTHPALPLGPTTDGEKRKFEDYYPRSMTGLGGLSLSAAGSSHIFRKDLSQIVMPLLVDPRNLTTELNPKLRVPEDAFPTIACVPGAMISFKYYIEVILDIQGKLAGSDKYFTQSTAENGAPIVDVDTSGSDRWGPHPYVDTTAIRRDKSVVTCILEIVIGTHDSERKKGKARPPAELNIRGNTDDGSLSSPRHSERSVTHQEGAALSRAHTWSTNRTAHHEHATGGHYDYGHYNDAHYDDPHYYDGHYYDGYDPHYNYAPHWYDYEAPPDFAPPEFEPPPVVHDENLPEKERARRAEARLLPSQPPPTTDESSSSMVPSAPTLDHDTIKRYDVDRELSVPSQDASLEESVLAGPSARASCPEFADQASQSTTANNNHNHRSTGEMGVQATHDKDEIRQHELMGQTSRPPPVSLQEQDVSSPTSIRQDGNHDRDFEPLVPSSSELDELEAQDAYAKAQAQTGASGGYLPRYQR